MTSAHHNTERGFTLVEVLVAMLILAVGVLGLVTLDFTAAAATTDTKAREGATNLTRELVEDLVAQPYSDISPGSVTGLLQSQPGLSPAPGYSGWQVLRRQIPYTVSVSGCYVDDPADGRGVHDASFCSGTAGSADAQPIDYKRFTVTATWTIKGVQRSYSQTTLLSGKGTADAPAVTSLTSGSGVAITSSSTTSVTFTATTSTTPSGVAWSVDDGIRGLATGAGTSWSFTWDISSVPDGDYSIGAMAYNAAGTYGTPISITVTLNRTVSSAPQGFVAGWNRATSTVDSEWLDSPEADTVGYTVYRQQTYPTAGSVTKVNCGTAVSPVYVTTDTSCTDASPIIPPSGQVDKITYRASASNDIGNSSSISIAKPSSVGAGDFLVATIAMSGTVGITSPGGWTLIRSGTHSTNLQLAAFYHVAGSSEPSSYTFTTADASKRTLGGGIASYSGVDTTAPVDVSGTTNGAGGNADSPNLTTTVANALVIHAAAFNENGSGNTITPDNSLTERFERERSPLNTDYSDATQATAGATGVKSADPIGSSNGNVSVFFALKPIGVGYNAMSVNYWVVAVDRDSLGNFREGPASSAVDAYATNRAPTAISSALTCAKGSDGSSNLSWTQPAQPGDPDTGDHIAFDRIYRDGARFDRTGLATDNTWTDPTPGPSTHRYWVTTVDTHLAESAATGQVTC